MPLIVVMMVDVVPIMDDVLSVWNEGARELP